MSVAEQLPRQQGADLDAAVTKAGGGSLVWKAGWTPLTIAEGLSFVNSLKRFPETATLLRRLMNERVVATERQSPPLTAPRRSPSSGDRCRAADR